MLGFNNSDRGISKKIPLIFYPKNTIEYFDGKIPSFHKEVIDQKFYFILNQFLNFERYNIDDFENFFYDSFKDCKIEELDFEDDKIIITTDDSYDFWDVIDFDYQLQIEDGLEKELLANAFNYFPNRNSWYLDMMYDLSYDEPPYEEDEENFNPYEEMYEEMKLINDFLNYKNTSDNKVIKNKYTLELCDFMNKHSNYIKKACVYLSIINQEDNHETFYMTSKLQKLIPIYVGEIFNYENYTTRVYISKDGKIEDEYKGRLYYETNKIKNNFDKIFEKWQTEHEKIYKN